MRYEVTAVSMDRLKRCKISEQKEIIDTESNDMFTAANRTGYLGMWIVESTYEMYWNTPLSSEFVKVIDVKRLDN